MIPPEEGLEELAGAVLDGDAVEWPGESPDPRRQALLRQLRLVQTVARLHRELLPLEAPAEWGHLRLLERVGRGSFGDVYRAWDTRLDREVALKLMPAAPASGGAAPSAIISEGRLLARVHHPNVVTIYGAEQIDDRVGLWMQFVRGATLEQRLRQGHAFTTAEILQIGVELCAAVTAVHSAGLLHRDIKAHNVMRADDGRILLMDFGTGRELDDASAPDVAGTPLYLAPELFRGEPATSTSDVYSVGVLLYHLASGGYPVNGRSVGELREAHSRGERATLREGASHISAGLARAIEQAIDPAVERRPQTAAALGADLLALQRRRRRRPLYASAAIAATALVALVTWAVRTQSAPSAATSAPQQPSIDQAGRGDPRTQTPADAVVPVVTGGADRGAAADPESRASVPLRVAEAGIRPSVQVLPFTNATGRDGDAWLSAALAEMVLREFRGAEAYRWIPGAVPLAKMQLGHALGASSQDVRPVTPADVVVSGEYRVRGPASGQPVGLVVTLKFEDTASGRSAPPLTETGPISELPALVSRLGFRARAAVAVADLTPSQQQALAASQPANAAAARAYAAGLGVVAPEAVELMDEAIAADPRFAPAYIRLAEGCMFRAGPPCPDQNLDCVREREKWMDRGKSMAAKAVELSSVLPREERLLIEIRAKMVIRDTGPTTFAARDEGFSELFRLFPDTLLYGFGTAQAQLRRRQIEDALKTVDAISRLPGAAEDIDLLRFEATLASTAGDLTRQANALDKAVAVAESSQNPGLLASIRVSQGGAAWRQGDLAKASWFAEEGVRQYETAGNNAGSSRASQLAGSIARDRGDIARSRAYFERIIATARARGDRRSERSAQYNLAYVVLQHGDLSGARATLEELIRQAEQESLPSDPSHALALGVVLFRQGSLSASQALVERVLADAGGSGNTDCLARQRLARLRLEQGDVAGAREHAMKSLQAARALGSVEDVASAVGVLARTLLAAGETAAARKATADARPLLGPSRCFRDAAIDLSIVGALIALDEGRPADGRSAAQQGVAIARADFRPDDEAAAEIMVALTWLADGNLFQAQESIARVEKRLSVSQDRLLRLTGGIASARVRAASGAAADVELARQRLEALSREAGEIGAVAIGFEARLALGEIEIKVGDTASGRARLTSLERDATARGFLTIAKKAAAVAR